MLSQRISLGHSLQPICMTVDLFLQENESSKYFLSHAFIEIKKNWQQFIKLNKSINTLQICKNCRQANSATGIFYYKVLLL